MTFVSQHLVRFAHVDSAGIVFYPRYFEMLNATVEDYFAEIGVSFASMHLERNLGVPTVRLESDFIRPSRLGELLDIKLTVNSVSRSSTELSFEATCGGEARFSARVVLVCIELGNGRPVEWPDDMRPIENAVRHTVASSAAAGAPT